VPQTKELAVPAETVRSALTNVAGAPRGAAARAADRSLREIVGDAARTAERQAICETLRATGGNKAEDFSS